jgi:hypothetical protein
MLIGQGDALDQCTAACHSPQNASALPMFFFAQTRTNHSTKQPGLLCAVGCILHVLCHCLCVLIHNPCLVNMRTESDCAVMCVACVLQTMLTGSCAGSWLVPTTERCRTGAAAQTTPLFTPDQNTQCFEQPCKHARSWHALACAWLNQFTAASMEWSTCLYDL